MLFVHAYPRETQEMVFDAHDRAFALFKGTCQRWSTTNISEIFMKFPVQRIRRRPDRYPLS
jgi:hypothetical protein